MELTKTVISLVKIAISLVKFVISLVKTMISLVKTATVSVDNAPDPSALPAYLMTSVTILVKSVTESVKTAAILVKSVTVFIPIATVLVQSVSEVRPFLVESSATASHWGQSGSVLVWHRDCLVKQRRVI